MQADDLSQAVDLGMAMKMGMRRLASGVCVLSTRDEQGVPFAMTVSSVTSVSDNPASLLVCVNKQVALEGHLSTLGSPFVVSILAHGQQEVSNLCAGFSGGDRFAAGDWQNNEQNLPYLADAQAVFFCESDQVSSYGTHHVVIGKITSVRMGSLEVDPLLYVDGGYAAIARDTHGED